MSAVPPRNQFAGIAPRTPRAPFLRGDAPVLYVIGEAGDGESLAKALATLPRGTTLLIADAALRGRLAWAWRRDMTNPAARLLRDRARRD